MRWYIVTEERLYHTHICERRGQPASPSFRFRLEALELRGARAGRIGTRRLRTSRSPAAPSPASAAPSASPRPGRSRAGRHAGAGRPRRAPARPCVAGHTGAQRRARCRGRGCGPLDGRVRRAGLHWPGRGRRRRGPRQVRAPPAAALSCPCRQRSTL